MGLVLAAGGLQQGFMWMAATEWLDSLVPVSPYWFIRTLAGIPLDIGMSLLGFHLLMTALRQPAAEPRADVAAGSPAERSEGSRIGKQWSSTCSTLGAPYHRKKKQT